MSHLAHRYESEVIHSVTQRQIQFNAYDGLTSGFMKGVPVGSKEFNGTSQVVGLGLLLSPAVLPGGGPVEGRGE